MPDLVYPSKHEQIELLQSVLLAQEKDGEIGVDTDEFVKAAGRPGGSSFHVRADGNAPAKRIAGSLNALSGATSMSCMRGGYHLEFVIILIRRTCRYGTKPKCQ